MKIIVLAGGLSPERDVSLTSDLASVKPCGERGHQAFLLDVFFGLPYDSEKLEEVFDLPGAGHGDCRRYQGLRLRTLKSSGFPDRISLTAISGPM